MGTHPIFESDFDCLTERKWHSEDLSQGWTAFSFRELSQRQKPRGEFCFQKLLRKLFLLEKFLLWAPVSEKRMVRSTLFRLRSVTKICCPNSGVKKFRSPLKNSTSSATLNFSESLSKNEN